MFCGCSFCGCSRPVSVFVVAFVSVCHFLLQSYFLAVIVNGGVARISATDSSFYPMVCSQILMVVAAIFLVLGAYWGKWCLGLLWILMTLANILYHMYIGAFLLKSLLNSQDRIKFGMLVLISASNFLLFFMIWTVICHFVNLKKKVKRGEENDPLMDRYRYG